MINSKKKIILIFIIIVAILAIVGVLLFQKMTKQDKTIDKKIEETKPVEKLELPKEELNLKIEKLNEDEKQIISLKNLTKMFTERFGTFSNQANFSSIYELKPLMTDVFTDWVEQSYLNYLEKKYKLEYGYQAVVTTALTSDLIEKTDSTASFLVKTQRVEKKKDQDNLVYNQSLKLELLKDTENNKWKVNSAYWEK